MAKSIRTETPKASKAKTPNKIVNLEKLSQEYDV